jgi:hypothetical protein
MEILCIVFMFQDYKSNPDKILLIRASASTSTLSTRKQLNCDCGTGISSSSRYRSNLSEMFGP